MKGFWIGWVFFLLTGSLFSQSLSDAIHIQLENPPQEKESLTKGSSILRFEEVKAYYAGRDFSPIWFQQEKISPLVRELQAEIKQSKYDGLKPETYHLDFLDHLLASEEQAENTQIPLTPEDLSQAETLLTDAFFALCRDLEIGKINSAKLKATWGIPFKKSKNSYGALLDQAFREGHLFLVLNSLRPPTKMYQAGRQLMMELEKKAQLEEDQNWKPIKLDRSIKLGDSHSSVPKIRSRLNFLGFPTSLTEIDSKNYDSLLFEQVVAYQRKEGLLDDGVIGPRTVASLNETPIQKMDKLSVNLERMRWIPNEFFLNDAIWVNIPSYRLHYRTDQDTLFSTKVIVGTLKNQTPVFSAELSYLIFSPFWNIPSSIARNETIPAIKKNPNYLEHNHMELINQSGHPVPNSSINWNAKPFPFLIRQKPGPDNALGQVKFMFPNSHNVYLHDTPAKSLFDRETRTFSHGCIRMQNPRQFAELILGQYPNWNSEKIGEAMNQAEEQRVDLDHRIPVIVVYLTFGLGEKGNPEFYTDVYNRDTEVLLLLKSVW